jgi:hypothetical protein
MADPSPIEMSVSVEGIQSLGRALFDRAMAGRNEFYKQAVHEAMEAMAQRIADRAGE